MATATHRTMASGPVGEKLASVLPSVRSTSAHEESHYKDWPNESGFNAQEEQLEPRQLKVQGHFPTYVSGSLLRVGPGSYKWPRSNQKDGFFETHHWFDGFCHVHKFEITPKASDGSSVITYMSRRQADKRLIHAQETGNFGAISFGQKRDPCESLFQKIKSTWAPRASLDPNAEDIGVAFTPSVHLSDSEPNKVSVTSDRNVMKEFDLATLSPTGVSLQKHLHPSLAGEMSAAHPQVCPVTGDIFNYNLTFGAKVTYRIFTVSAKTRETTILATISGSDIKPAYLHSFFLTEHFVVLAIWPAHFTAGGASILWNRNVIDSIGKWDPSAPVIWLVVDRGSRGLVAKFTSPSMFAFHTTNAFEQPASNGSVDLVCEVVQYPTSAILKKFYYKNLTSTGPEVAKWSNTDHPELRPSMTRYRLAGIPLTGKPNLRASRTAEILSNIASDAVGDLPTINSSLATKPHRYVYSVLDRGRSSWIDGLGKTDCTTAALAAEWSAPGQSPSEAIFIADPNGSAEDDGVLLSVVLDGYRGTSYLLCLDARDMTELGRADVDAAVGLGFHGTMVAGRL